MSEWISVDERMPEPGEWGAKVIGAGSGGFVGEVSWVQPRFTKRPMKPRWEWMGRICPFNITHWMPMPEPPKTEDRSKS